MVQIAGAASILSFTIEKKYLFLKIKQDCGGQNSFQQQRHKKVKS